MKFLYYVILTTLAIPSFAETNTFTFDVTKYICDKEGFREEAYLCPAGVKTIGYGETDPEIVSKGKITEPEARALVIKHISEIQEQLIETIGDNWYLLTYGERCALVSFVYNVGIGNFKKSTLLKKIKNAQFDECPEEIQKWVYSGGVRLRGLEIRRREESEIWKGTYHNK